MSDQPTPPIEPIESAQAMAGIKASPESTPESSPESIDARARQLLGMKGATVKNRSIWHPHRHR